MKKILVIFLMLVFSSVSFALSKQEIEENKSKAEKYSYTFTASLDKNKETDTDVKNGKIGLAYTWKSFNSYKISSSPYISTSSTEVKDEKTRVDKIGAEAITFTYLGETFQPYTGIGISRNRNTTSDNKREYETTPTFTVGINMLFRKNDYLSLNLSHTKSYEDFYKRTISDKYEIGLSIDILALYKDLSD